MYSSLCVSVCVFEREREREKWCVCDSQESNNLSVYNGKSKKWVERGSEAKKLSANHFRMKKRKRSSSRALLNQQPRGLVAKTTFFVAQRCKVWPLCADLTENDVETFWLSGGAQNISGKVAIKQETALPWAKRMIGKTLTLEKQ